MAREISDGKGIDLELIPPLVVYDVMYTIVHTLMEHLSYHSLTHNQIYNYSSKQHTNRISVIGGGKYLVTNDMFSHNLYMTYQIV